MNKLTVKTLIEFRRKKSDKSKKTFVESIQSPKIEIPKESGGDYWIAALSAINESYQINTLSAINSKIINLQEKLTNTARSITKNMYQQNLALLSKYKRINLVPFRPSGELTFLKKSSSNAVLTVKGFQIVSNPSLIYTFGKKGREQIGGIWFTAKINGYAIEEVGMFCDLLYKFLNHNYSKKYSVIPKYCIAIDTFSANTVTYANIESGKTPQVLSSTFDEISRFM
jgi:hypothetical protein